MEKYRILISIILEERLVYCYLFNPQKHKHGSMNKAILIRFETLEFKTNSHRVGEGIVK